MIQQHYFLFNKTIRKAIALRVRFHVETNKQKYIDDSVVTCSGDSWWCDVHRARPTKSLPPTKHMFGDNEVKMPFRFGHTKLCWFRLNFALLHVIHMETMIVGVEHCKRTHIHTHTCSIRSVSVVECATHKTLVETCNKHSLWPLDTALCVHHSTHTHKIIMISLLLSMPFDDSTWRGHIVWPLCDRIY